MPTEIEQLQNEIKTLKGEMLELNKTVLGYMYVCKSLQEVVITNETDRLEVERRVVEKMGTYSKQLRASMARIEGNDMLYRLFKNSDSDLEQSS
jgi:hypothetical protein